MSLGLMGATTLFAQERETNIPADPQTGKPSTSAIAEDPQLMLNFEDVPLQSVLEYMSEAAGFIILGDTKVSGDVTILSKQPLNREEAVDLLDAILNEKGYTAIRRGRILKIVEKNKVFSQVKHLPGYLKAVVVIPNKPISTARSRTSLPRSYSKENAVFNLSHTAMTVAAFWNEDWEMLRLATQDRFHQKIRMKMLPELFSVQKLAFDSGALMSTLSGSGSTFFSMVYDLSGCTT